MFAKEIEHEERQEAQLIRYRRRPDRIIPPGSIIHLAPTINREFGGGFADDVPITEVVEIVPDFNGGRSTVRLIDRYWQRIGATDLQLGRVTKVFRNLIARAPDIDTFGKLRRACEAGQIVRMPGLDDAAELLFTESFKKSP